MADVAAIEEKVFAHWDKLEFKEMRDVAAKALEESPDNARLMYLVSRADSDLIDRVEATEKEAKLAMVDESLKRLQVVVEKQPDMWEAYRLIAQMYSKRLGLVDAKTKIENTYKIKEYADKAKELHDKDALTYYILGKWSFDLANIGWMTRTAAATMYGSLPEATLEESLEYLMKASQLAEGQAKIPVTQLSISNTLGDLHVAMSNNEEAVKAWQVGASMEVPDACKDIKAEITRKLDDLKGQM
eukprot:TRINITY_DN80600_c0_g1_i1.p2 TRINITY_DN80600_c0_g1~~TRINITY_DN80600_c0_g1_i1.p2  ORF type:complete len:244 (+),score=88.79 TRINITY_DN80600_c0_g1_i1:94-825(+)